jgi:hypothetical protein
LEKLIKCPVCLAQFVPLPSTDSTPHGSIDGNAEPNLSESVTEDLQMQLPSLAIENCDQKPFSTSLGVKTMFCRECGREMSNMAIACPNCGCAASNRHASASGEGVSQANIVLGYVLAVLFCPVGLILGIISTVKGNDSQKGHGIAAIVISLIVWGISIAAFAQEL